MVKINLLPWREELRQQKQQNFIAAIGAGVGVTLILFGLVYWYIEEMKNYQEQRNAMLDVQIQLVNTKIKEINKIEENKQELLTKIEVIQSLQDSRPQIVHLFDELPKSTPAGVFLLAFKQVGKSLSFSGKAQSNARISAFMQSIDASAWLEAPVLEFIKGGGKAAGGSLHGFSMRAKQGENKPKDQQR